MKAPVLNTSSCSNDNILPMFGTIHCQLWLKYDKMGNFVTKLPKSKVR